MTGIYFFKNRLLSGTLAALLLSFSSGPSGALRAEANALWPDTTDRIGVLVDQAVPKAGARVGVGSGLTLKFPTDAKAHSGIFLGQMVKANGTLDQMILLDSERKRVVFADRSVVQPFHQSTQKVLRPYPQVDGTCTGYAIHHLMAQLRVTGMSGNSTLQDTFGTEQGRTQFLVRAVNDYYIATQHRSSINGILKIYGKEFGLHCSRRMFSDGIRATQFVVEKTNEGIPILISFFTGPTMNTGPFTLQDLSGARKLLDQRIWVPRKIGERESGGHSVLAVSTFEFHGRTEFLMLDSDWEQPRVWDASNELSERTDFKTLEFYTCE